MNNKKLIAIIATAAVILIAGLVVFILEQNSQLSEKDAEMKAKLEQAEREKEQIALENEYEKLNADFTNYENQAQLTVNDSILNKYTEAKKRVESLLKELKTQKITSEKRIGELKSEIETLKGIMRHYVEVIDSLKKENKSLRDENEVIKGENQQLNSRVADVSQKNAVLNQRMTLAEKLNVTGLSLTAINSKGKAEKKLGKVKQLKVTFTIPQNNSTPVGDKTLYVRLTSPEGNVLGGSGSFRFEGGNVEYTERKTIEYAGEEISGITIYWNVNTTLTAGSYKVEIFTSDYRIASRSFTIAEK